ncbi:MAG: dTMP kinase [Candidatus Aenigmarchaeota archaeon]|nr:dTMP kinase [Candidatus Aenigmarchaeota archaeon]
MKGKFIVFEGIDGSGKSTQFELFCRKLEEYGKDVVRTHEPTTGKIGKLINDMIHTKNDVPEKVMGTIYGLLFYADRIEHVHKIKRWLEEGKIVISDRYYHSTLAYQKTQGMDFDFLISLHKNLQEKEYIIKPDLTFIIDVSAEESMKRINNRDKKRVEIFERLEFLKELRKNYLELKNILDERIEVIDGSGSIEEVHEEVMKKFKGLRGI